MAKNVKSNPWVFDTQDEGEGKACDAAGISVSFPTKLKVDSIQIDAGAAGGTFEVTDAPSGRSLTGSLVLPANDHVQVKVGGWVDGVYMTALPDGQILVFMSPS